MNLVTLIFIWLIKQYQRFIVPLFLPVFGHACRYKETCSQYTIRILKERGLVRGIPLCVRRFLSCW